MSCHGASIPKRRVCRTNTPAAPLAALHVPRAPGLGRAAREASGSWTARWQAPADPGLPTPLRLCTLLAEVGKLPTGFTYRTPSSAAQALAHPAPRVPAMTRPAPPSLGPAGGQAVQEGGRAQPRVLLGRAGTDGRQAPGGAVQQDRPAQAGAPYRCTASVPHIPHGC